MITKPINPALIIFALCLLSYQANAQQTNLFEKNACLQCHATKNKVIGPAFSDIAKRYAAQKGDKKLVATLVNKIKEGSSGNWGSIPMTPHPKLSHTEAEEMVRQILNTSP